MPNCSWGCQWHWGACRAEADYGTRLRLGWSRRWCWDEAGASVGLRPMVGLGCWWCPTVPGAPQWCWDGAHAGLGPLAMVPGYGWGPCRAVASGGTGLGLGAQPSAANGPSPTWAPAPAQYHCQPWPCTGPSPIPAPPMAPAAVRCHCQPQSCAGPGPIPALPMALALAPAPVQASAKMGPEPTQG